ncbi:uncharacterized protein EKO05_0010620 [Ascochyta rabiei]|uniref:uncharacterized protein n=1 Tax=Didymella rabiei TaxID=5454 RepID=UPI0021FD14BA|nr:uncharacterized protein EKO05_0010620 [Ascochyta rabiei]UPX20387.1 hypothetical protein EKO05_0010620 [Ascochyta rabiei]
MTPLVPGNHRRSSNARTRFSKAPVKTRYSVSNSAYEIQRLSIVSASAVPGSSCIVTCHPSTTITQRSSRSKYCESRDLTRTTWHLTGYRHRHYLRRTLGISIHILPKIERESKKKKKSKKKKDQPTSPSHQQ